MSVSAASSSAGSSITVPRVGGVRCYWALLAPEFADPATGSEFELRFVHFDPVLTSHLARQKMSMMGRGVIEFIHPGEREQARKDLGSAIAADDLQGSVTRMRFARLTRIRQILGASPDEAKNPHDAETYSEDEEYLIVDLVLNWVADGLLLAFFHAIKDKDPVANNDPTRRNDEWTNFCGTADMPEEQIQSLHQNISINIAPPQRTRFPPTRVFQLHSAPDGPSSSMLIFSWPPPRPPHMGGPGDGLYDADEYGDLMRGVDMDPSLLSTKPGELRTNCTTRFGAEHTMRSEHLFRHISSVFIPYGSLIFACFQTTKLFELQPTSSTSRSPTEWADENPLHPHHPESLHPHTHLPPQLPPEVYHPPPPTYGMGNNGGPGSTMPVSPAPTSLHPVNAYPQLYYEPVPAYLQQQRQGPKGGSLSAERSSPRGTMLASSRPLVRPPGDVDKCRGCGIRESPEWRKGENGIKDLCNACGLKLARAVAKREGRQKPRKKKEKTAA